MSVLMTPPYLQFFDANGAPLAGGKVNTYTATGAFSTRKATFTTEVGDVEHPNPVILDAAGPPDTGNGSIWLDGTYDFVVTDTNDVTIETTLSVTAFTALPSVSNAYFESFSGTGAQTAFTTSDDLGTDEKAIFVWIDAGAGDAEGYDIQNPSAYTINGTTLTFSVAPATGTNNIFVSAPSLLVGAASSSAAAASASAAAAAASETSAAADLVLTNADVVLTGLDVVLTNADVVSTGNDLTATNADVVSTGDDVTTTAANVVLSNSAVSSVNNKWLFDTSTSMADPGTGDIRFNNATPASVTAIAISALAADTGNPDLHDWIVTWDDSTNSTDRGTFTITKSGVPTTFAVYKISGALTDNTTWVQLAVTYVAGSGTFSNSDTTYARFATAGNAGAGLSAVVDDTTPQLGGDLDCNGSQIQWSKGADVASGTALPVLTDGNYFDVTGTSTITSINTTGGAGTQIKLHFDGILTLTHDATDLILPGAANITTAAGDEAEFIEYASGDYRCTNYSKADGTSVVSSGGWVTVKNITISSDVTVEFEDGVSGVVLDTTFDEYRIVIRNMIPSTNNTGFNIEFSDDGGSTSENIKWHSMQPASNGSTYGGSAGTSTFMTIFPGAGTNTGENCDGILYLGNLNSSTYKNVFMQGHQYNSDANGQVARVSGTVTTTSVIDSITFTTDGTNIASGSLILEGRTF